MDRMSCTLLIPAAGASQRFQARTPLPKGVLTLHWNGVAKAMIDHIVPMNWEGAVHVGVRNADAAIFRERIRNEQAHIQPMHPTSGQAETVRNLALMSSEEDDVMVVNSDNAFRPGVLMNFLDYCRHMELHLGVLVFKPTGNLERYGYVDRHPSFTCGVEKSPISQYALAGAFYFSSPSMIIRYAGIRTHYVSEWFIDVPKPKMSYLIPQHELHEWGTPEALEADVEVTRIEWENEQ